MKSRRSLDGERFDVIVIGGGINGVAIARECARGGRRTLLVEQHDFAAGTTSRSTRIIHGGLRYLEHGDLAQVRESLRERQRLARQYPNLVRPLEFLLAVDGNSSRSSLMVRAGLWLYGHLGGSLTGAGNGTRPHKKDGRADLERLLDSGRRFSIFSFEDAQCEFPERLVAEWLRDAMDAGCVALNHTRVLEVTVHDKRANGVRLRDRFTGNEETVEATWIVNATGPWADGVCQGSGIHMQQPMVGGVRGSHLVMPKFPGAPNAAIYAEAADGRPFFVIPWNEQILVGTTEVADQGDPGRAQPSTHEIRYLLDSVRRLFPSCGERVTYTFAGVRPLPYSADAHPSATTRRHFFHDHSDDGAAGMISVVGGKLTTAASLARECAGVLGIQGIPDPALAIAPQSAVENVFEQRASELAQQGGTSQQAAQGLMEWFGERAKSVVMPAAEDERLRLPLCSGSKHVVAEAVYALNNEAAVTLGDILLRRVPIAFAGDWTREHTREAAQRIGAAMQWDEKRIECEVGSFEEERDAFLRKPTAEGVSTGR